VSGNRLYELVETEKQMLDHDRITPQAPSSRIGGHALLVFEGCEPDSIGSHDSLLPVMHEVAERLRATIVGDAWHDFEPTGTTCVVLLAESHIAAHSWPETGVLVIDLLSCGSVIDTEGAADVVKRHTLAKSWHSGAEAVRNAV